MKKLKRLYYRMFKRYRRLEVRCFNYDEADRRIRENAGKPERDQWRIAAREEDRNTMAGIVVFLERVERIWE